MKLSFDETTNNTTPWPWHCHQLVFVARAADSPIHLTTWKILISIRQSRM